MPHRKLSWMRTSHLTSRSPDRSHRDSEDLRFRTTGGLYYRFPQRFAANTSGFIFADVDLKWTSCSWRGSDSPSPRGWWLASGTAAKHGGLWASRRSGESGRRGFGGSLEAPRAGAGQNTSLFTDLCGPRTVLFVSLPARGCPSVCGTGAAQQQRRPDAVDRG